MDVDRIVRIIASIGIDGARWVEENIDEQFRALQYLYEHIGDRDLFPRLVVANALLSYQLSGTGEEWWWEFARWFSEQEVEDIVDAFKQFLPKSRANRRLTGVKINRLERAKRFLEEIDVNRYYGNMLTLRNDLARMLGSQRDAKTVVFAVKMFGYAMRIATKNFIPYPMEITIPVDSRIRRITAVLTNEDPIRFWQGVAEESGVPPLHIGSLLWPLSRKEARRRFVEQFGENGKALLFILNADNV